MKMQMLETASIIKPLIDKLKENYGKYYDPPETVCIDESIVSFRGSVVFRQYMKHKRHGKIIQIML